jgi:hypothetical protein
MPTEEAQHGPRHSLVLLLCTWEWGRSGRSAKFSNARDTIPQNYQQTTWDNTLKQRRSKQRQRKLQQQHQQHQLQQQKQQQQHLHQHSLTQLELGRHCMNPTWMDSTTQPLPSKLSTTSLQVSMTGPVASTTVAPSLGSTRGMGRAWEHLFRRQWTSQKQRSWARGERACATRTCTTGHTAITTRHTTVEHSQADVGDGGGRRGVQRRVLVHHPHLGSGGDALPHTTTARPPSFTSAAITPTTPSDRRQWNTLHMPSTTLAC